MSPAGVPASPGGGRSVMSAAPMPPLTVSRWHRENPHGRPRKFESRGGLPTDRLGTVRYTLPVMCDRGFSPRSFHPTLFNRHNLPDGMSLYDWAFTNPELVPLYAAFAVLLGAWLYASTRKLLAWGSQISASMRSEWSRSSPLPPDSMTTEIFLFGVVLSINLVLIGAYLYLVT